MPCTVGNKKALLNGLKLRTQVGCCWTDNVMMPDPAGPAGAAAPLVDGDADVSADVLGAEDAAAEDAAVDAAADVLVAGEAPPCDVDAEPQAARMLATITKSENHDIVRLNIERLLCNVEKSDNASNCGHTNGDNKRRAPPF